MSGYPRRYVVFDTETTTRRDPGDHARTEQIFRLGCALIVDREFTGGDEPYPLKFYDPDVLIDHLLNMPLTKEPIYVFAHNIGFDVRSIGLFRRLGSGDFSLMPPECRDGYKRYKEPLFIPESPPFIVRLWNDRGQSYMLLDTYQWLKVSLAEIGGWIGMPKGVMPTADAPESEWYEYCMQDVRITLEALKRTWEFLWNRNIRDFHVTPATQSMFLYRTKWERKRITRPSTLESMEFERMAYYGGRVDCFKIGRIEGPVSQVDVSAMYPYVMSRNYYPCRVAEFADTLQRSKPWADMKPHTMTAECFLDTNSTPYPVRCSDGTIWAIGRVRTILCGPEFEKALTAGHVAYIGRNVTYELDDLFTGFVNQWWRLRQSSKAKGNALDEHLCKVFMNSLHGKFGQKQGEWSYRGREMPDRYYASGKVVGKKKGEDIQFRSLAGHVYYRNMDEEDPRGFVPIASWTASHARVAMDELRAISGPGDTYYQATDSLLVSAQGLWRLDEAGRIETGRMGSLRIEGSYPWVEIHGLNQVTDPFRKRRSGVRRNAVDHGNEIYEQEQWEGFAESIFQGNSDSIGITKILKRIRLGYHHGHTLETGWTQPFEIDNWDMTPEKQRWEPLNRQPAGRPQ